MRDQDHDHDQEQEQEQGQPRLGDYSSLLMAWRESLMVGRRPVSAYGDFLLAQTQGCGICWALRQGVPW
jgi:hypothetical protein